MQKLLMEFKKNKTLEPKYTLQRSLETSTYMISRFFLADLAFTFLPLAVIAIMRSALGKFDEGFFTDPEWSFAAIIIYGLAMTRVLELKVKYQRDHSERLFVLARFGILGVVAAVLSLALSQMRAAGLPVSTRSVLQMQIPVLATGLFLLLIAHWAREKFVKLRDALPAGISIVRYLNFIGDDLRSARNVVDELSGKMGRRHSFSFEGPEQEADYTEWVSRRIRDIDFLIEDLELCVGRLRQVRQTWGETKVLAQPENGDLPTP